jgi:hypothetical protein
VRALDASGKQSGASAPVSATTAQITQDYTVAASPGSLSLARGGTAGTTIAITRSNFTGAVSTTVSGLPSGVTVVLNPATATTGNSVTATFSASSTATLGPATVTFTATSGTLSRTTSVSLNVMGTGDFTIGPGSATTVTRGSTASSVIAINRTSFTGAVGFGASGLPSGVTVAFSPSTATTGNSVTATFTASSTATLGTANVTITGTSGTTSRSTTIALTVNSGPGGGALTATSAVTSNSPWFVEEQVRIANTGTLTALTITVTVQRTTGINHSGQYNTVGGQITQSVATTASTITYTFTLAPGQTLGASTSRTFAVQLSGNGTAHPTAGDTYVVSYNAGSGTQTASGTF